MAVVIPCFNAGLVLLEAVASAEAEADELVIVDDGSTDPLTLRLLRDIGRRGIRIHSQENSGLSAARMAGAGATNCPYLLPLDADDVLEPGALSELADALDTHPWAAVAWGDLQTFGLTKFQVPSVPVLDPWFVTYASLLPGPGSLYRRTALYEVGGWCRERAWEDWDLWMALAEHEYRGIYVPRVVYRYRRSAGSMMMRSLDEYEDLYQELQRRHQRLFQERGRNRVRSSAPAAVKLLVPLVDRLPLRPLTKLWTFQVMAHLFWNGGFARTSALVLKALAVRSRCSLFPKRSWPGSLTRNGQGHMDA